MVPNFFSNISFHVVLLAIAIDLTIMELPNRIHPVVWMGKIVDAYKGRFPPTHEKFDLIRSMGLSVGLPLGAAGVGFIFSHSIITAAIALSTTFSFGYFKKTLQILLTTFQSGNLEKMRIGVAMLVSRKTHDLSEPELLGAAVETTIENITDAIVAPLCCYVIGGLPLAMAYRAVNTLDAMIGYKDKYFYYGKISARIDDVANFVPARLVAATLLIVSLVRREFDCGVWKVFLRDRNNTDSPNAGQTMAAAAAIFRVQLTKRATYSLGEPINLVTIQTLEKSISYLQIVSFSWFFLILALLAFWRQS